MNILRYKQDKKYSPNDVNHELPTHIYLDANLHNNTFVEPNGSSQYIPAQLGQNRDNPFIYDSSYYNLAVARFSISADAVPRTFQDVRTTATTGTYQTKEWVGVSYNGVYYDQAVVIPTTLDPLQTPVKAIYNINEYLDIINEAWLLSQTAAQAGGAPTGPAGQQVLMIYDNNTMLYTINSPIFYGTGGIGTTGNGIGIHMSIILFQKFSSFNVIQNSPLLYNNHDITFKRNYTGNNIINNIVLSGTGTTGDPYLQIKQDKAWGSSIIDAHRLIITTSSLPVYSEYIALVNPLTVPSGNQTLSILSDFLIGHDSEISSRGSNFIYVPSLYRLTSLKGSTPLTYWDIKVYIVNADGSIYPLYLPPNGECSIKLLFLLKGLSN
jgi:hypothetical protein